MSRTMRKTAEFVIASQAPVAGLTGGGPPGYFAESQPKPTNVWLRAAKNGAVDAVLARMVAEFPLSNAELLASVEECKPPQSWYDEDHEGLF
jgi:hypothetical protein